MRRTVLACRSGFSVAAAAVLLTACGGSDNSASPGSSASSSSAATSSATTSSATSGASAADSQFCRDAAAVEQHVGAATSGESDPSSLTTVLDQVVQEIRGIEPPAELQSDWRSFADGIEQIAAAANVDLNDPAAVATFQQKVAALEQQFGTAFSNVQNYLAETCGLTGQTTAPASPTG
jgi:hypothetical protein